MECGTLAIGIIALGVCGLGLADAWLYQVLQGHRLDEVLRRAGVVGPAGRSDMAGAPPFDIGSVIGRLEISRIGLSAVVSEGVDAHTLLVAVGHLPGTALPGEEGNVVLSAHRDSFFRGLGRMRNGDLVTLTTPRGRFTYRIESSAVVTPDRVELLGSTDSRMMTLITCYPFSYIGPAPKRFVLRAQQVESSRGRPE